MTFIITSLTFIMSVGKFSVQEVATLCKAQEVAKIAYEKAQQKLNEFKQDLDSEIANTESLISEVNKKAKQWNECVRQINYEIGMMMSDQAEIKRVLEFVHNVEKQIKDQFENQTDNQIENQTDNQIESFKINVNNKEIQKRLSMSIATIMTFVSQSIECIANASSYCEEGLESKKVARVALEESENKTRADIERLNEKLTSLKEIKKQFNTPADDNKEKESEELMEHKQ